jgi:hypothetical protein
MTGRRTLLEGLKPRQKADRKKAEAFVFGEKEEPKPQARRPKTAPAKTGGRGGEKPPPPPATTELQALTGRVPLNSRIRPDMATALKRASLERQLSGELPNTIQDIVEQALEPWLKDKGYLKD